MTNNFRFFSTFFEHFGDQFRNVFLQFNRHVLRNCCYIDWVQPGKLVIHVYAKGDGI
jgi:hypothetical protein